MIIQFNSASLVQNLNQYDPKFNSWCWKMSKDIKSSFSTSELTILFDIPNSCLYYIILTKTELINEVKNVFFTKSSSNNFIIILKKKINIRILLLLGEKRRNCNLSIHVYIYNLYSQIWWKKPNSIVQLHKEYGDVLCKFRMILSTSLKGK